VIPFGGSSFFVFFEEKSPNNMVFPGRTSSLAKEFRVSLEYFVEFRVVEKCFLCCKES